MYTRYTTLAEVKANYAQAKPAEKGQIVAFVRANSEGRLGPFGKFSLIRMLNSYGREFLTVSMLLEGKGLTADQMREVLGLPKFKKVEPVVQPRKKLTKGGRRSA